MLQIFIPSYRRPDTTTTPALLDECGVKYTLIVREYEYAAYRASFPSSKIMTIGNKDGLNAAREAARQQVNKGAWCLHMDDNVRGFVQCKKGFYRHNDCIVLDENETMITRAKWQSTLCEPATFAQFYDLIVCDTLVEANGRGAYLAGFSAHENPAFRGKKFTDVGYVCGKVMLMRNCGLSWNQSKESSGEDYALTAAHLYDHGRVLINKWGHPLRAHYQQGGCGPYDERLPAMLRAQRELKRRYGDLFAIKNEGKSDKKQGELRIRFTNLEQVDVWRRALKKDPNRRMI